MTDEPAETGNFREAFGEAAQPAEVPPEEILEALAAPGPASAASETPDDPSLEERLERERQRLKSLEGRFRRERADWQREREELLARLAAERPAEEVPAPEADTQADSPVPEETLARLRQEALEAVRPLVQDILAERHARLIAAAHPDWEDVARSEDLLAWIDAQPGYLAATLRRVAENGSAEEVIDLIGRYKRECCSACSGEPAASAAARPEVRDASAVRSRPAGPPKPRPVAADFTGAWSEAAQNAEN